MVQSGLKGLMVGHMIRVKCALFVSAETKTEEEDEVTEVKKRVPLSLEELLAKKKAEEAAQSKVGEILSKHYDEQQCLHRRLSCFVRMKCKLNMCGVSVCSQSF